VRMSAQIAGTGGERPRGRPPRTSLDAIAEAVIACGFDRATTGEIAAKVGVDQSTLYGYVTNRAELLHIGAEKAVAGLAWPTIEGDDWRSYLRACSEQLWDLYSSHPGLAGYIRGVETIPSEIAARGGDVVQVLLEHVNRTPREAAIIVTTFGDLIIDSFLTTERTARSRPVYIEDAITPDDSPETWWRDKIELLLDGIAYRLGR
jgi:AcrR family transcriptional regulator